MPQRAEYQPPTQFSVFPPVIKNLLILNGLVFFAQLTMNSFLMTWFALWPLGGPSYVFTLGGPDAVPQFWPWQIITYAFLHGGFGHIFFNLFALWMFGTQIENIWGSRRFGVFYFVCVVGAGLAQMAVTWGSSVPTVGASGGVYGILLAFGMMFPERRIMLLFPPIPIKAKWFVLGLGAFELFSAVTGTQAGVANFAHLGGAVVGFGLIQYWRGRLPLEPEQPMRW